MNAREFISLNPYPERDEHKHPNDCRRLQSDIWSSDYDFVRYILQEKGTVQTTINILWKRLTDELKRQGITDHTQESRFIDFVANCAIIRGTTERNVPP